MGSYIVEQADEIWADFRNTVFYKDRYFIKHRLLDIVKKYVENHVVHVLADSKFYRARIIDEGAVQEHRIAKWVQHEGDEINEYDTKCRENDFYGLTKEASFVPLNNKVVKDGRANPKLVKYLYMAKHPVTAMLEVRPLISDRLNLAQIRVKVDLVLVDLTKNFGSTNEIETVEEVIMSYVNGMFSIPISNSDEYIPTQIIAEYIKNLGYDGIMFWSSLHKGGINYTIFDYDKCEAVNSRDFKIENFKLTARSTTPWGKDDFWFIKDNECIPLKKEKMK